MAEVQQHYGFLEELPAFNLKARATGSCHQGSGFKGNLLLKGLLWQEYQDLGSHAKVYVCSNFLTCTLL